MANTAGSDAVLADTLRAARQARGGPRAVLARGYLLARRKPLGAISVVLILLLMFTAATADLLAPMDPVTMDSDEVLTGPSEKHLLGTDHIGRDVLSRIMHGARISLAVGFGAVVLGLSVGVFFGMVSAYFRGRLDMFIQRISDSIQAFPGIIFALAIIAALGPSLANVTLAIGIGNIPRANRVVRGSVLSEQTNVYVDAARAMGASNARIMWRHIMPNVTAPVIIIGATEFGSAILSEAGLSFLGLGVPAPLPSWGGMLSGNARTYSFVAPWTVLFPGIAISLAVLGWNLLGDALRDVWDPRLRGQ